MNRNLKAVGLAVFAVLALGALTAQGASASEKAHEFHSDGSWTVGTGKSTGKMKMAVGSAGTVECNGQFEDNALGTEVSASTYKADTLTVTAHFTECTFGGSAVNFNMNHCAFILDSDTTSGNSDGGEHANVEIECSEGNEIEMDTSVCTITVGPQLVKHVMRYEADGATSMNGIVTAKKVKTGKKKTTENQTGCALFPTGEIGTVTGNGTTECFKDETLSRPSGTEKTTPTEKTSEGASTECSVTNL